MIKRIYISIVCFIIFSSSYSQQWQSDLVFYTDDGKLVYIRDSEGNTIPDFSYAGYKNGNDTIPFVPVVKTISPIAGDNTLHIQSALFEVGLMPINSDGIRGALLLNTGTYEIKGTINLGFDGVVLRGSGDGSDPASNTILNATGNSPNQRTVLIAGGGASTKWREQVSGTKTNIITDTILVGESQFEVENIASYKVGDNIIIFHPGTDGWLQAVDYGGTHSNDPGADPSVDLPWSPNAWPIVFNRYIKEIEGNKITIDVPLFNTLVKSQSQSYIYKYARTGLKTNIGIEDLRIDIQSAGGTDESHAWQAIDLYLIEDSWVRNCTMLHFGQSAVRCNTATRITVVDCDALDPVSTIEGERRYNFNVYTASQQILFYRCNATDGRHAYVSNGTTWTSGCAFVDCTSKGAYTSSEGHRSWSMGILFDNLIELDGPRPGLNPRLLGLYNRGYYGTSHGWAIAHSVAWNCDVAKGYLIVQKPPTAQNYAIGCKGNITGKYPSAPFDEPEGYIEGANKNNLHPRSLYLAQYEERMKNIVSVKEFVHSASIPESFELFQNYPNPFNPSTTISFSLPQNSKIIVKVYNSIGKEVKELYNGYMEKGTNFLKWNGTNNHHGKAASGIYFLTVSSDLGMRTIKMMLIQ
ncbi:MAG: T9SS type A sorting domain-containing protein [Bacteroidetes bacterium]|nr:T9SS type A sorting domain-containing protein [Bacteroidota bacterium]MBU2506777.1 T9SS type A sorting domain-containing protein [Bacteroidota bacterium]